ncbi:MAG TPA: hypothetical protein DEQ61_08375 [Streptomyces sp.]|nr:hypothetical protein [Streptomyces sp.]
MADIKFTVDLPSGPVEASVLDPFSERTVPDQRGCPDCQGDAYFSGCTAEGCNGYGCQDCGTGCDLDFVDAEDGGHCAADLEDDEDEDDEAGATR